MESFNFTCEDGTTATGIASIPARRSQQPKYRPLVVGLHGGGYNCEYFDGEAGHTALHASRNLGVPFVAIDRPCYGGTSSILPLAPESSFQEASAARLHTQILPLIWAKYGIRESCTCMVLLCHSLGVAVGIPIAAMHAQEGHHLYPLGGIIASGLAHQRHARAVEGTSTVHEHPTDFIESGPIEEKDKIMFLPGTVDPKVLEHSMRLNHPVPKAEVTGMIDTWIPQWRTRWGAHVVVPVLFVIASGDPYFVASQEHLQECTEAFSRSSHVEGSLIIGAPHCMELSYWSSGWYSRCFGFALECATSFGVVTAESN